MNLVDCPSIEGFQDFSETNLASKLRFSGAYLVVEYEQSGHQESNRRRALEFYVTRGGPSDSFDSFDSMTLER